MQDDDNGHEVPIYIGKIYNITKNRVELNTKILSLHSVK